MRNLSDAIAVVTGAGSGIGRATSAALARHGCHVALVDRDPSGLEESARSVRAAGRRASLHRADVAERTQMERLVDEVSRSHGRVHVLVNNAGVTVRGSFADHSLDDFERVVAVNLFGVAYGCKLFLPLLLRERESHIVNLSSLLGLVGLPTQTAYSAAKFGVRGFSEALRAELRGSGVGLTCVFPGAVRTNFVASSKDYDRASSQRLDRSYRFLGAALPPERVATRIVRAIQRDRERLVLRFDAHLAGWSAGLLPRLTQRVIGWSYRRLRPVRERAALSDRAVG